MMANDGNVILARIAALRTPEECDNMEVNCLGRGEAAFAVAAKKRGIELRAQSDKPADDVAKAAYEAVAAYESVLRIRHNGKNVKASRTRRMLGNRGVIEGVARVVGRNEDSVGYSALLEHGLDQYAFEHVVLRFPHVFSPEIQQRAQARLAGENSVVASGSRPRIADLLQDAGFDPNGISYDRSFLSQWAWTDGKVIVATVWVHEIEDGQERVIYDPVDSAQYQGVRLVKARDHRSILAGAIGHPVRVILQSKGAVPGISTARTRALDSVPWSSELEGGSIVLTRQSTGQVAVADTPWSDEELRATVKAYLSMGKALAEGQPIIKKRYYQDLAQTYGRTSKAYEYRMQNISYVLSLLGRRWIPGLVPARNVGASAIERIEKFIADAESKLASGQASFEAIVKEERLKIRKSKSAPPGSAVPRSVSTVVSQYARDPAVKAWVLEVANGICECCEQPAPFSTADGPYLEVHHVRHLAQRGSDSVTNAVAICPNCHRRLHYAIDGAGLLEGLYQRVKRLIPE